jgi:hypothetical protein
MAASRLGAGGSAGVAELHRPSGWFLGEIEQKTAGTRSRGFAATGRSPSSLAPSTLQDYR